MAHLHVDYWVSDSQVCPDGHSQQQWGHVPHQDDVRLMCMCTGKHPPQFRELTEGYQGESSFWLWVKPNSL